MKEINPDNSILRPLILVENFIEAQSGQKGDVPMLPNVIKNTITATHLLVENCLEAQTKFPYTGIGISMKKYIKEFCTVKIGGPRQIGHTSAALDLLSNTQYSIIVTPIYRLAMQACDRCLKEKCRECKTCNPSSCPHILTPNKTRGLNTSNISLVIVDNSFMMKPKQIEDITSQFYDRLKDGEKFCIVLLQ